MARSNGAETPAGSLFNRLPLTDNVDLASFPICNINGYYVLACVLFAWSTRQADPITLTEEGLPDYITLSVQGLAYRVKYQSSLLWSNDVFAANLLGWVAYSTCSQGAEAHIHFNGSMGMLTFLMEKEGSERNPHLVNFGPSIIDCANAWATRNGGIPQRLTSFQQRVKYFEELFGADNSGVWYSGTLEAANATLGNLMEITLRVVCEIARRTRVSIQESNGRSVALRQSGTGRCGSPRRSSDNLRLISRRPHQSHHRRRPIDYSSISPPPLRSPPPSLFWSSPRSKSAFRL
jgi:hypothetical protein